MVLNAQAQRNWRIAAILCSAFVGIQATFFTEYDVATKNGEHVFSGIQAKTRKLWNLYIHGQALEDKPQNENKK